MIAAGAEVIIPGEIPLSVMGNSFATVVAAEMLAANDGLGYLIASSQLWLEIETIFAGVIVLGVLGFAADRLFQWLIDRFGGRNAVRRPGFE